jgi:signal transduction histidine kinase/CheY-like chemotaxis protein
MSLALGRWSLASPDPAQARDLPPGIAGRVRARQVLAIARLTPVLMAASVLNALAVVLVFALSGEAVAPIAVWAGVAVAAAGWFAWGWWRRRGRPFPEELGRKTIVKATRNALLFGLIWAAPCVLLLPGAGPSAQAFLIVVAGGMISGGVAAFYPIPAAALAYGGAIVLGALIGVAQADAALFFGGLIVTAAYFVVFRRIVARHAEVFVAEIVAGRRLEERNRRIAELMDRTRDEARDLAEGSLRRLEQAQKLEALGQLTGGMAHDFNNILTVVRGNAELQQEDGTLDPELLSEIITATERGADLIQKLLAYARRQSLRPERLDLPAVVDELTGLLRRMLGEAVALEAACEAERFTVRADRSQLEAAVINLATNARDAMPRGGRLTIRCARRELAPDEAEALSERLGHDIAPGRYGALAVRDEGPGMAPEIAARAFEPFFTTKPVGAGTGLGLSMAQGFTRQSGGFVTLRSAPGAGTEVTLHLPLDLDGLAAETREGEPPAPRGGGERVLLVEDQAEVRRTLATMLRGLGYDVTSTADAREAEARLARDPPPDLVLSDVVLPGGLSGVDLAARIEAGDRSIPVVLMSGYPELRRAGDGALRDRAVLRKPFTRDELARALSEALR